MSQSTFIGKIAQAIQERKAKKQQDKQNRENNTPKYKISNLYVGSIIKIENEWWSGDTHHWTYEPIKKCEILYDESWFDYKHIVSGHTLKMFYRNQVGQIVVNKNPPLIELEKRIQVFMLENNLTPDDCLSKNQIIQLENELNPNYVSALSYLFDAK